MEKQIGSKACLNMELRIKNHIQVKPMLMKTGKQKKESKNISWVKIISSIVFQKKEILF